MSYCIHIVFEIGGLRVGGSGRWITLELMKIGVIAGGKVTEADYACLAGVQCFGH